MAGCLPGSTSDRAYTVPRGTVSIRVGLLGFVPLGTVANTRAPVLFHDDLLEGFGLSAEDSAALHAIMAVGSQGRLGFLT
jgi:hypothetical protein